MREVLEKIGKIGIVPVIKIDDAKNAVPLAMALAEGGIPCAEITFRTAAAEETIHRIRQEFPDVLAGAGTVLSIEQADKAIAAGAEFIVSPGLNPALVTYCLEKGIPVIPGCATPSDIEKALEFGLETVKFFPAEQAGGIEYIKAVSAPYPSVKFIPTGGINAQNISAYIAFDRVLACGGSWMAPAELITTGNFEKISILARQAVFSLLDFFPAYTGINAGSEDAAIKAAGLLTALFGFTGKDGTDAVFAVDNIRISKHSGPGVHGHIAIRTASIMRAVFYLERSGLELDYNSIEKDSKGNVCAICLKEEILGFALKIVQSSGK